MHIEHRTIQPSSQIFGIFGNEALEHLKRARVFEVSDELLGVSDREK